MRQYARRKRRDGSHWSWYHRGEDNTKAYLSNVALRRIVRDAQSEILKIYEFGISHGLFVVGLAAPAPMRSSDKYGRQPTRDLATYFEEPIRTHLSARGVPVINVIESTLNNDGELKSEFIGQDGFRAGLRPSSTMLAFSNDAQRRRRPGPERTVTVAVCAR